MESSVTGDLRQHWPRPASPKPIVILGCGDIVRDAHIPAYNKADYSVAGVFDLDRETAEARAAEAGGAIVYDSLEDAVRDPDVIFDVATPPKAHLEILEPLPDGCALIMQKPFGRNIADARTLLACCRRKGLRAAVNFQLRFSPQMLAIKDFISKGQAGELVDIDVHLALLTPWDAFPFLKEEARVEIQMHTIHYLDVIRHLAGEPNGVYARTVKHPGFPDFAQTKSSIILDYGENLRCCLSINHCHDFGDRMMDARFRVEGVKGAADARLGLLLDYPRGKPDVLAIYGERTNGWVDVPLQGSWFPDGFVGTMSNLQRYVSGEDESLVSSVEDAFRTMALVEACYESNANGATPILWESEEVAS